jgi:hypothetical protein
MMFKKDEQQRVAIAKEKKRVNWSVIKRKQRRNYSRTKAQREERIPL